MEQYNCREANQAKKFYDQRYVSGYMEEWKADKKKRVLDLIKSLPLPKEGKALDFGCGNGVFTEVVRQALPGWKIYGSDVSAESIKNAKKRYPLCSFFVSSDTNPEPSLQSSFDFIFSHHVLEHVYDLSRTVQELHFYSKPGAYVLHILPCGNEGSFEHSIALLRKDGIQKEMENRFFYDDPSHLRRLTTATLASSMEKGEFSLQDEWYANHFFGGLLWVSVSNYKTINNFTDYKKGAGAVQKLKLILWRFILLLLWILQKPYRLWQGVTHKKEKRLIHYIFLIGDFFPQLFTGFVPRMIARKASYEWTRFAKLRNGSEMYLLFKR